MLGRLKGVPAMPEAALVLDRIASEGRLSAAARALEGQLRGVPKRPMAFVDAVLRWVVREASIERAAPQRGPQALRLRWADAVLLGAAVLPAATLPAL